MQFYVKPSVCWRDLDVIDHALNRFYGLKTDRWVIQSIGELLDLCPIDLTDIVHWYDRGLCLILTNLNF